MQSDVVQERDIANAELPNPNEACSVSSEKYVLQTMEAREPSAEAQISTIKAREDRR